MDWWISSLRQKYHFEDSDVQALIALLLLRGEPVFPLHPIAVCTAPYENHLLEIAVTGHASALVTTGSQLLRTPKFGLTGCGGGLTRMVQ